MSRLDSRPFPIAAIGATIVLAALASGCVGTLDSDGSRRGDFPTFDVQGHRGARGLRPENTLPAFEHALELGVSTLELDLGLSRDGQVVVTHEPRIEPGLCLDSHGEPLGVPGPRVLDLDLAELERFDCGLNPDPQRFPEPPRRNLPGSRIPTLVEVFELVQSRGDREVRFNLEVKLEPGSPDTPEPARFVPLVLAVIERHGLLERCTLQSFDWKALRIAKTLAPALRTSALLGAPDTLGPVWQDGLALEDYGSVLRLLLAARAYVDDFSPYWEHLLPGQGYLGASVADYQRAGFRVLPWTVNDVPTMERLIDLGVDGIISDRPDLLLEVTRARGMRVR